MSYTGSERRTDNWTLLVKEYEPKIGFRYKDHRGKEYIFFGLVHADDDYYYGLMDLDGKMVLASCVGGLDSMYEQIPNDGRCEHCNAVLPIEYQCRRYRCPFKRPAATEEGVKKEATKGRRDG